MKIKSLFALALLLNIITALPLAARDKPVMFVPPTPRIYASVYGQIALKVFPNEQTKKATAILFELDQDDGTEKVKWQGELLNIPGKVLLAPRHNIVTLDNWGDFGHEHALVIYGQKGGSHRPAVEFIRAIRLEELLTEAEIAIHVRYSHPTRSWHEGASFTFNNTSPGSLRIELDWGKVIVVALQSGNIWIKPQTPQEVAKLKQTLRTGDESSQLQAMELLAVVKLTELLDDVAGLLDSNASLKVRQKAAITLYSMADIKFYDSYIKHLKSPDSLIRSEMALGLRALEQQGTAPGLLTEAVPSLIEAADPDNNLGINFAAVGTLGEIGDIRAISVLRKILNSDLDEERRYFIKRILADLESKAEKQGATK